MNALLLAPTETAMTAMVCIELLDCSALIVTRLKLKSLFCLGQYTYPLASSHFETLASC